MTDTEKMLANARIDLLALVAVAKYALRHAQKPGQVDRRIAEMLADVIDIVEAKYR